MAVHISQYKGKRVHMLGIGGSSMSGLAQLLKEQGYIVTGSDSTRSHKTEHLESLGIPVSIGHRAESVHGAELIIYSAAISVDNPERAEARRLGIPQIERCVLLGQLMEGVKNAICIAGTHGKTTTTAMMSQVFMEAGEDPTVHIGGEFDFLGGSTRHGEGDEFICEACEFNASFLKFHPTIAVILNIDEDHLDFYKDIDHIEQAFTEYASLVPEDGWVIGWGDDRRVRNVLSKMKCHTRTYGLEPFNEIRAEQISYDDEGRAWFTATLFGHPLCEVRMSVAGEHNLLDALAVVATAAVCELPMHRAAEAIEAFHGAHRRFERTSVTDGVSVYQDYGHNPTEMKNALKIAKLQPHHELWAVWQPHTYSRTKDLFHGFVETFDGVDHVLITDICAAREKDPGDIHSTMLLEPIRARGIHVEYTPTFDDAENYLRAHWHSGDVVVTQGCGDIDLLNEQIALHGDTKKE